MRTQTRPLPDPAVYNVDATGTWRPRPACPRYRLLVRDAPHTIFSLRSCSNGCDLIREHLLVCAHAHKPPWTFVLHARFLSRVTLLQFCAARAVFTVGALSFPCPAGTRRQVETCASSPASLGLFFVGFRTLCLLRLWVNNLDWSIFTSS